MFCVTGSTYAVGGGGAEGGRRDAPGPKVFTWRTNLTKGEETIVIEPSEVVGEAEERGVGAPEFVCAVVALGGPKFNTEFEVDLGYEYDTAMLVGEERELMREVYLACCGGPEDCEKWPHQVSHFPSQAFDDDDGEGAGRGDVELDGVILDFCHVRGCECNSEGRLKVLDLDYYGLKCPFPHQFGLLEGLSDLHLTGNILEGDLQEALATLVPLRRLRNLSLKRNSMQGSMDGEDDPEQEANAFCRLASKLDSLSLEGNVIGGTLPPCALDGSLTHLVVSNNLITGSLPPVSRTDSPLALFGASDNGLTGTIPESFGSLSMLRHLELSNNEITGSLPPSLVALPRLRFLLLASNVLGGGIPDGIAESGSLQKIWLNDNQFGALPDRWLHSQGSGALSVLDISENAIAGTFPLGLSRSPNLTTVQINNNALFGSLPPVEGLFPKTTRIEFKGNQFSGSIPDEWGTLGLFQAGSAQDVLPPVPVLDLSDNELTGSIPAFLDPQAPHFPSRLRVYLAGNNLNCGDKERIQGDKVFGVECAEVALLGSSGGSGDNSNDRTAHIAAAVGLPVLAAVAIFLMFFVRRSTEPPPAPEMTEMPAVNEHVKEWGVPGSAGKVSARATERMEHWNSGYSGYSAHSGPSGPPRPPGRSRRPPTVYVDSGYSGHMDSGYTGHLDSGYSGHSGHSGLMDSGYSRRSR
ncbi:unnamed protein product [Ostreobium quekettii]|uniref:Uncharacterized protein n=1 Tax=Ostreobium quekettii TaxID=121088 RepID=A0A8S1JBV6_9CHLO|nr:unnamed protein product [Ostreobium quekettii]|eukprot:evm.model.scf_184.2 EVM.evm.TU.scf_184.2   scf_184:6017-8969(+)